MIEKTHEQQSRWEYLATTKISTLLSAVSQILYSTKHFCRGVRGTHSSLVDLLQKHPAEPAGVVVPVVCVNQGQRCQLRSGTTKGE